jgi:serine/threonine-protein kinase PpkA
MPTALIVDDEEGLRKSIERLLTLEGFDVATAPNGQHGLVIARSMLPDVIITDVNMPGMDGFNLVDALRNDPELSTTTIIMLTAAEDRSAMRRGMALGADDYITKPFKREELLESIGMQFKKRQLTLKRQQQAIAAAVSATQTELQSLFEKRFTRSSPSSFGGYVSPSVDGAQEATSLASATMLFADIRGFTAIAERLSADELAGMLSQYFDAACQPVLAHGGRHLKMLGDGLMALFEDASSAHELPHAKRALLAGLALQAVALKFKDHMGRRFSERGLSPFAIGVGIHSGPVTLGKLGATDAQEITPLGDTVNIAARLEAASKDLGWAMVVSTETVALSGAGLQTGRQETLALRGREQPVQVCEVLGTTDVIDVNLLSADAKAEDQRASVQDASRKHSQLAARAAKDAINQSLWHLASGGFRLDGMPVRFKGYEVRKKLGEGGMSDVYLAYSENLDREVVLKVLKTGVHTDADMLRRFIQEYAVLGSIEHPHVARIYDQGFTDDYAYIAMEYLSGGELKSLVTTTLSHARVLDLTRQIVSALSEVHRLGLVYRDLKPDNLMFRASGELVLVDFGIVKSTRTGDASLVKTQHGQIVGTPYYISPEQATDAAITHRSDFYSLGVLVYELLTGDKPFKADSLDLLLARHLYGAIPTLPLEHAMFQPLLSSLLAKRPDERPADCQAIWSALKQLEERVSH